jgi:L-histidine Nalpha-methyltransferase / hercynylcysteine S-oxide synthase
MRLLVALDLEQRELDRTLLSTRSQLGSVLTGKVSTMGLLGTYEDGIHYFRQGLERLLDAVEDIDTSSGTPSLSSPSSGTSSPDPGWTADSPPLFFMFLGSSLGNFAPHEAVQFLGSLPLRPGSGDRLLLGLDHDNPASIVEPAYNDPQGLTEDFILNGLRCAGRTLGDETLLERGSWGYEGQYNISESQWGKLVTTSPS